MKKEKPMSDMEKRFTKNNEPDKIFSDDQGKKWYKCNVCGWKYALSDPTCPKCISEAFGL